MLSLRNSLFPEKCELSLKVFLFPLSRSYLDNYPEGISRLPMLYAIYFYLSLTNEILDSLSSSLPFSTSLLTSWSGNFLGLFFKKKEVFHICVHLWHNYDVSYVTIYSNSKFYHHAEGETRTQDSSLVTIPRTNTGCRAPFELVPFSLGLRRTNR